MEQWRKVWRVAAGMLPQKGLEALAKALREDDPRLIQGATTSPPPLVCVQEWSTEAACVIGFCGWQGGVLATDTVAEVEEFFAKMCYDIDEALKEPAVIRYLLNWFDETPREDMRAQLLAEVDLELNRREEEKLADTALQIRVLNNF